MFYVAALLAAAHLRTCEDIARAEMNPDQSALSERWSANPMRQAGKDALDRLRRGLAPNAARLPVVNGLADLRGFQFPSPVVLNEISGSAGPLSGRDRVQRIKGRETLHRITLADVDFSFAKVGGTFWENCTFERVKFREADLRSVRFAACNFKDVDFDQSNMENTYHGTTINSTNGTYERVTFRASNLVRSVYSSPRFSNCDFSRARLDGVDFRGSRFERCKFAGRLNQVWFRGRFPDASPGEQEALRRTGIDPASLVNPMHQVDFSDAVLDDCMFVNGIDLSTCRFSNDGVHIVIRNRTATFRELEDRISRTWSEPSRSAALRLCQRLSSRQDKVGQAMDVINRQTFGAPPTGKAESRAWLPTFLALVQQLSQEPKLS